MTRHRATDDGPFDQAWDRAMDAAIRSDRLPCDTRKTQPIPRETLAELAAERWARLEREGES